MGGWRGGMALHAVPPCLAHRELDCTDVHVWRLIVVPLTASERGVSELCESPFLPYGFALMRGAGRQRQPMPAAPATLLGSNRSNNSRSSNGIEAAISTNTRSNSRKNLGMRTYCLRPSASKFRSNQGSCCSQQGQGLAHETEKTGGAAPCAWASVKPPTIQGGGPARSSLGQPWQPC